MLIPECFDQLLINFNDLNANTVLFFFFFFFLHNRVTLWISLHMVAVTIGESIRRAASMMQLRNEESYRRDSRTVESHQVIFRSTSFCMHAFSPFATTCIHYVIPLLIPDWSKGVSLETASFIHVQTHNLLKHSHRIPSSRLCTSFRGIQLWHLISPPDQIAQPEITERILHLWFAILPFCMYSCALHTANYGLTLIIMDFVCSQQPLTAHTFLWTIGNWTN